MLVSTRRERRVTERARWSIAALPALTVTALALTALGWIDPSVLCLLPVLGLALVLALQRYPGEQILRRLSGRPREPLKRRSGSDRRGDARRRRCRVAACCSPARWR